MTDLSFPSGVAFNLTLLQFADKSELAYLGLNEKQRETMLKKEYMLARNATMDRPAQYRWSWVQQPNQTKKWDEFTEFNPNKIKSSYEAKQQAAHEMTHAKNAKSALRLHNLANFPGKKMRMAASLGAGAYMWLHHWTPTVSGIVGGIVGVGSYLVSKAAQNVVAYRDEKKSYAYQGKIAAIADQGGTVAEVDAQIQKWQKKRTFLGDAYNMLIKGYPGLAEQHMTMLEQKRDFLMNSTSLFPAAKMQQIDRAADTNLYNGRLPIYQKN